MKAMVWAVSSALLGALGCQGALDGGASEASGAAGPGSGMAGEPAAGGAGATAPVFQPLGGPSAIVCDPTLEGLGTRRIWRLTREQYENTVGALLGDASHPAAAFNPEPGSAQGFQNDAFSLRVRGPEAAQFQAAARKLAEQAVTADLSRIAPCAAIAPSDPACAASFVQAFGRQAFRRPPSDAEQARYVELFQLGLAKRDAALGVQVVVEAMLQSPYFLFRSELGEASQAGQVRLTDHELAAFVSYTFLAGPPDTELNALADAGQLGTPGALEAQARRLLSAAAARPTLWQFYRQLFEVSALTDLPKDATIFPEFDAAKADLEASARAFVEHVLFDADAQLSSLLASPQLFVNERLSPFFGVTGSSATLELVTPAAGERPGLLGHPAVMSVLSARTRTSPVNRGRFVRARLLCQGIPDPPAGADTQLPLLEPGLSARQQLAAKTSGAACVGCHSLMNPVGFGFEKLDAVGRYRAEENGVAIDDTGALTETRDIDGPFQGVGELAQKLSGSVQAQECLAVQGFRYVLGRPENGGDACAVARARDRFIAARLDLKELYLAIATSTSLGSRKAD